MLKIDKLMGVLDGFAPLRLSHLLIEGGDYDNSGLLVKCNEDVNGVLFSLDLSDKAVELATKLGYNTIVTHHPAIYNPIKSLSVDDTTSCIVNAIKNNINVISMHLNLDVVKDGIDSELSKGIGAKEVKILQPLDQDNGYGREYCLNQDIELIANRIKQELSTDKVLVYGKGECKVMASFCGGGASHAMDMVLSGQTKADTILTSDLAHHVIKALIEKDKKIIIIPHYVAENYGFKKYFERVTNALNKQVSTQFFSDERFM